MVTSCQRSVFSLPDDIVYLNCATMSPLTQAVEAAGIQGVLRKSQPHTITQDHFFDTLEIVKSRFAAIINTQAERIALMPSVSYGMATVVKNLLQKRKPHARQKIVLVGEEFPSDVYPWEELTQACGVRIETILAPETFEQRGQKWNEQLLAAIDDRTLLVCISPTHWADGTLFDLEAVGAKCRNNGAFFVIDGTQHVGAYPFDIQQIKPDFLICAAYKWLLGPYGNALAYCSDFFDDGHPLEQTWTGRLNSNDFKNLIHYQSDYRPGAYRYNMGEFSNFIQLPMLAEALQQVLDWTPAGIQRYAQQLLQAPLSALENMGFWVEEPTWRASHLLGIRPLQGQDINQIRTALLSEQVYVSYRGSSIRLSVHVWNDASDLERLVRVMRNIA
jgi:selenocysteine lyase/cysteine desulfurase